MSLHRLLIIFLTILTALPAAVQAQSDDVQVNLEVLDELGDYKPPPMFFEGFEPVVPKLRITDTTVNNPRAVKPEPVESQPLTPRASSRIQSNLPELVSTPPPKPPKKPVRRPAQKTQPLPYTKIIEPETQQAVPSASNEMPRKNKTAEPETTARKIGIDITAQDPLMQQLSNPTAIDVLKKIDPDVEMPDIVQSPPQPIEKTQDIEILKENYIRVIFRPGELSLPDDQAQILPVSVKEKLRKNPNARLEIRAFANPQGQSRSDARRISLARTLDIQALLSAAGISDNIMDLRPLGNETKEMPIDRVDIFYVTP